MGKETSDPANAVSEVIEAGRRHHNGRLQGALDAIQAALHVSGGSEEHVRAKDLV